MWERIKHMLVKEFIQIFRDPRMKGVIFLMPIIQLLVFGYAVTTDVKDIATLIHDLDNSIASRELVSRFVKSGYFHVVEYTDREERARELLDRGNVGAVLRMNKGFEEDLRAGRTSQLQVIVDGTDSNTAGIVLGYSSKIAGQFSADLLTQRILRSSGPLGQTGRVAVETRAWFNENLESRNFYVPGVIAIIVMLITLMLTSMAVVREKEIGTMEQIMVTPITSTEFILGKTVPFALIGFADVILITLVGVFWFEVPIRGNLGLTLRRDCFVPADDTRDRPVDIDGQSDTATGHDEHLFLLFPGGAPLGVHVSNCQYAGSRTVADLSEPAAVLSGDHSRHFPQGCGAERPVAPDAGAGRHGARRLVAGYETISQNARLIRKRDQAKTWIFKGWRFT